MLKKTFTLAISMRATARLVRTVAIHLGAVTILIGMMGSIAFAQENSGWASFTSAEGRFTVLMPTKPKIEVKDTDTAQGTLQLHLFSSSNDNAYFLVSYNDFPSVDEANKQAALEAGRTGAIDSMGGALVSERKISIGNDPGLEFSAKKVSEGSEIIANARLYFVGQRLYQLLVLAYKPHADSPDIQKFLTSFELAK
jgi:hypothetical protein